MVCYIFGKMFSKNSQIKENLYDVNIMIFWVNILIENISISIYN